MKLFKRISLLLLLAVAAGWTIAASRSKVIDKEVAEDLSLADAERNQADTVDGRIFYELPAPVPLLDSFPSFIDLSVNTILNEAALHPFFERLKRLEAREVGKVTVVHIGDSHIQADLLTGRVRLLLQQRFGAAGRGFIFPYRLADTNSPLDLKSGTDAMWDYRRNIYDRSGLPIGLSGMGIQTRKQNFTMVMQIKPDSLFDYSFDKVSLYYQEGPDYFDYRLGYFKPGQKVAQAVNYTRKYHKVRSGETLSGIARKYRCSVRQLQRWNGIRGSLIRVGQRLVVGSGGSQASFAGRPFQELAKIEQPNSGAKPALMSFLSEKSFDELVIKGAKHSAQQRKGLIYGISVEDSKRAGLLYHSIGVNGASFYHYNRAEYFMDQLPTLEPDLVVVSLGTNEALSSGFKEAGFREEVDDFLASVRERLPTNTAILVTTNPDALKRGRIGKTTNPIAREVLIETAEKYHAAIWDLQAIMKVSGGVQKWRAEGLSGKDLIHFTRTGYELQGHLLYEALMDTYELH
ncbi:MAG: LysM peptidoglycan-binding domain-containing protein [Saprospiraceae bacterium]|nr:LysM peptidoglycan-binding domain-containing protein [Saprospiraceae bacterium]